MEKMAKKRERERRIWKKV